MTHLVKFNSVRKTAHAELPSKHEALMVRLAHHEWGLEGPIAPMLDYSKRNNGELSYGF